MPAVRFARDKVAAYVREMTACAAAIEGDFVQQAIMGG
jgi:hypothetical protein